MGVPSKPKPPIYGYLAEFDRSEALFACAKASRAKGYTVMEAYTPMPLHGLTEILGYTNDLPRIVLCGGVVGAIAGFGLQYWVSVLEYPVNIGGRPLNSWPAFIVPMFETTILFAALAAVFGMLWLNGLPQPYHPVFNVPRFALSTRNRFFLCVEATDPLFDRELTRKFLEGIVPGSVTEVEH